MHYSFFTINLFSTKIEYNVDKIFAYKLENPRWSSMRKVQKS